MIDNIELSDINLGKPFIFPTCTVYGIGVVLGFDTGIIYKLKKREIHKPLSIHILKNMDYQKYWKDCPKDILLLVENLAPGPYTFIYYKNSMILPDTVFPYKKIGLRFPKNLKFRKLINLIKKPVWGTSVNISGEKSITDISDIPNEIKNHVCCIIEDGNSNGLESTVLDLTKNNIKDMVLRHGSGSIDAVEQFLKK